MRLLAIITSTMALALCGALRRASFRYVETRWQIATFAIVAALIELGATERGNKANRLRFATNVACSAAAIVAVKWHIEGLSPLILRLVA